MQGAAIQKFAILLMVMGGFIGLQDSFRFPVLASNSEPIMVFALFIGFFGFIIEAGIADPGD